MKNIIALALVVIGVVTPTINANAQIKNQNINTNSIELSEEEANYLIQQIGNEDGNSKARGATTNRYYLEGYSGYLASKGLEIKK